MGKATSSPLLFGAILLAAVGALWLATLAVLPERTGAADTSASGSARATDEGPSPATLEAPAPEPAAEPPTPAPDPTAAATRTKVIAQGQTLRALVVDREGTPRASLEVTLDSSRRRDARILGTSAVDGTLSFPDLQPGTYYPIIAGHEILEPTKRVEVEASKEPAVVRIVCVPVPVLAGRIVDHAGNPVPTVWVIVEDLSGAEVNKVVSAGDGTFRIQGSTRSIKHDGVRLWVYSGGKLAMARKHATHWGDVAIELRVAPAPSATLRVVAAGNGEPVRNVRLWVDLAPGVRAETPWVADGWIVTKPDQDPEVTGLGLVPLRLSVFPTDVRFACHSVDVPGGASCHDVRVELGATATLAVRTEPPAARATVEVLRLPAKIRRGMPAPPPWERAQLDPQAQDLVLVVGQSRTDERGWANVRGGKPGETVVVRVRGKGLAGQTDTTLAPDSEVVVPISGTASVEVTLAQKPNASLQTFVERVTADGGPDPLGSGVPLQFDPPPSAKAMPAFKSISSAEDTRRMNLWLRAFQMRDARAITELLDDKTLDADVRREIEIFRDRDTRRARVDDLPPGRYRIVRFISGERVPSALAEFELSAGEHKDLVLDLAQPGQLELNVTLPPAHPSWALVDDDTGALSTAADARAGRARVIVFAFDGRRWLSRDVFTIPPHGVVTWTPNLVPMRITLRLRTPDGRPLGNAAVSRVGSYETTAGWHGQALGLTDAAGEIELSGNVHPFKLRVDGITALVGPYAPDPRRETQLIEVEVPFR